MTTPIQIRTDLVFQFDTHSLGDTHINYHLNDFLVRVETLRPSAQKNEIRYGVMVDFANDDSYWKKSYILEIPVSASKALERQHAQEDIIDQYLDEMRQKFTEHYAAATQNESKTVDEFDKIERTLQSADGRWNIYRQFRTHVLTPFSDWLLKGQYLTPQDLEIELVRSRMAFETNQDYVISVDWACPYICYTQPYSIAHFKDIYGGPAIRISMVAQRCFARSIITHGNKTPYKHASPSTETRNIPIFINAVSNSNPTTTPCSLFTAM